MGHAVNVHARATLITPPDEFLGMYDESGRKWMMDAVRRADDGDSEAMKALDELSGRRIEEIGTRALDRLIAEGSSWAPLLLGRLFEERGQTDDDVCTAIRLYEESAEKTNPYAMVAMARIFERGDHVVRSFHNAYIQYKRAASMGCPPAVRWMERNGEKGKC